MLPRVPHKLKNPKPQATCLDEPRRLVALASELGLCDKPARLQAFCISQTASPSTICPTRNVHTCECICVVLIVCICICTYVFLFLCLYPTMQLYMHTTCVYTYPYVHAYIRYVHAHLCILCNMCVCVCVRVLLCLPSC